MSVWYEVPAGLQLFAEFDTIAPTRDHTSDGTIGDSAHQKEVSDHNPDSEGAVRAIDVDNTLNTPGLTMEDVVQFLLTRGRSGAEKRITYMIYERRIWSQDNAWKQVAYTGSSPHTEHAHFSFSHNDTLANNKGSFHLEDIPVALTDDDKAWITDQIRYLVTDVDKTGLSETPVGHAALSQQVPDMTKLNSPQTNFFTAFGNLASVVMDIKASVAEIENGVEELHADGK